ncbi:hypothetical protein FRC01_001847 [Tulasnella sp. 417]|nr:hypothetical protein FRC01_001847 [Tulasnella sp. 417]
MESDPTEARNRIMWAFCEAVKDARSEHGHTHRLTLEAEERALNLFNMLHVMELIDAVKAKQAESGSQESSSWHDPGLVRFSSEEIDSEQSRTTGSSMRGHNTREKATEEKGDSDSKYVEKTASIPAKKTIAKATSSQDRRRPAGRGVRS